MHTLSGGPWGPSTINGNASRGTGILNNELYIGRRVWNRLKYVKNPDTGKRQSRPNPAPAWITKELPHLRIVPQEMWDAVKARQARMARPTRTNQGSNKADFWRHQRPRYLLSGLMKCGACGASYTKCGAHRFARAGARDRATCSNSLTIRGDELEKLILDGLKGRPMEPTLFEEFAREFMAEVNRQRTAASASKTRIRSDLEAPERQIKQLVDAIIGGADANAINTRLKDLEAQKARLTDELSAASPDKPLLHPNLATLYRSRIEALGTALRDTEHGPEAFDIIRSLIEEVRLVPVDGALTIELRGELAGIPSFSENAKQPLGSTPEKALQIKGCGGLKPASPILPLVPAVSPNSAHLRRVCRRTHRAGGCHVRHVDRSIATNGATNREAQFFLWLITQLLTPSL
jgi:hypothetical protein